MKTWSLTLMACQCQKSLKSCKNNNLMQTKLNINELKKLFLLQRNVKFTSYFSTQCRSEKLK